MILLTGFYHDPDPHRRGELVECVKLNIANDWIKEVRVFIEDETARETLTDAGCSHAIFFDDSLVRLNGYDLNGKVLCLSRWDVQPNGGSGGSSNDAGKT